MSDFRSFKRAPTRPKEPKGPVKLSFGIVPPKEVTKPDSYLQSNIANPQPVANTPNVSEFPPYVKSPLVGALVVQKKNFQLSKPLPPEHLTRVETNLSKIYDHGRFQEHRVQVDYLDEELLVTFPFDQNIIDHLKGLDRTERAWDPENKLWRVFPAIFDDLFDILGKNFRLTERAYHAIQEIIQTSYYAFIGKGKLGKLIVRESWFEQLFQEDALPSRTALHGSTAYQQLAEKYKKPTEEGLKYREIINKSEFKRKPHLHQLEGMEFLLANSNCALLDEMGCGKSFQIAGSLKILFEEGKITRALVVAPMSLTRTWQQELSLGTNLNFLVISGSPAKRKKLLETKTDIFIIHYEGLRLEEDSLSRWLAEKPSVLIFDESQRIKNLQTQTTTAALKIRNSALRCIIATGTPIANRPLDLFSQYLVMDKGETFGLKFSAFKNTFCELDVQKIQVGRKTIRVEKFIGVKNGKELQTRIQQTSLRRLKSQVLDLPPVLYKDFVIELKAEQKTMYMQMRDNLRIEISSLSEKDLKKEAANIMVKLLRLSQICSNPQLLDENYSGPNAKLSELEDLVEDTLSDECKKIIIWTHFVGNIKTILSKFGDKIKCVGHSGDMPLQEREKSVQLFQDDPEYRIFVATPQSAKEGLTLLPKDGKMVADTMIYMDLSFDSASYLQSQARFHRIGQVADRCLIVHLVGDGTVDEYIRKNIIEKIKTATELLDDKSVNTFESLKSSSAALTKDDFLSAL